MNTDSEPPKQRGGSRLARANTPLPVGFEATRHPGESLLLSTRGTRVNVRTFGTLRRKLTIFSLVSAQLRRTRASGRSAPSRTHRKVTLAGESGSRGSTPRMRARAERVVFDLLSRPYGFPCASLFLSLPLRMTPHTSGRNNMATPLPYCHYHYDELFIPVSARQPLERARGST